MSTIKHILFPFDFSEHCRGVVPSVESMASRFGAEVTVISVALPFWSLGAGDPTGPLTFDSVEARRELRAKLDQALIKEFANLQVTRIAESGDPARIISDFAQTNGVDLIMMPTHGYGPFRHLLLGSVTAKVLHDAECAVWTGAHVQEATSSPPGVCRKILCAVDTTSQDISVIRWASEFAKELDAELHLVHAIPSALEADIQSDRVFREYLFNTAHQNLKRIQDEAGVELEAIVRGGKPEQAVRNTAQDLNADLVVIGRGRLQKPFGRLRSHAYAIIRESPCPVISVGDSIIPATIVATPCLAVG